MRRTAVLPIVSVIVSVILSVIVSLSLQVVAGPADASDTTRPKTRITAGPGGPTSDDTPEFGFRSSEKRSTFTCRVDQGRPQRCTSPRTLAHLADGSHVLSVVATDRAGNKDRTPAVRAFVVDTTAPDASIVAGPAQASTVGPDGSSFTFGSSEAGATFECQLDAGAFAACGASRTYPGLAEGSHTLWVRACDQLANCDPTPAVRTWAVDGTPPVTSIDSGPTGGAASASNDPSFAFSADPAPAASFECRLDSGDFAICTSPRQYADLADGPHMFEVRACDAVGNCDQTPAGRTWTVDTTPPDTTLTGTPAVPTSDNLAQFTYNGSGAADLAGFECRLDVPQYTACPSSATSFTVTRNVAHSFQVRACDVLHNCDPSPATWVWTVDSAAYLPVNDVGDPREVDFCRVQFPVAVFTTSSASVTVFGRIFDAGLTPPAGSNPQISGQLGLGPDGTDPRTAPGWSWVDAAYNSGYSGIDGDDEYAGTFSAPVAPGQYDYAFRFSIDQGNTGTYCDVNGAGSNPGAVFEPGPQLGQLMVS